MAERFFAKARTADLIVQEMGPETLVFDRRTDVAHNLSPVASVVWNLCDGRHDVDALVAAAAAVQPADTELAVEAALSDLTDKGLLETGVSRRDAVKKMTKLGAGAFAVPLIVSVMAPAAAMATSPGQQLIGTHCTLDTQCAGTMVCTHGVAGNGGAGSGQTYCNVATCTTDGARPGNNNCTSNSQCCSNSCNGTNGKCNPA